MHTCHVGSLLAPFVTVRRGFFTEIKSYFITKMGRCRHARKKQKVQETTPTSEFQTPMLTIMDEDTIADFDLKQLSLSSVTYSCCFQHTDADRTPHILCHYLGVDVTTLREELRTFIGANVSWIKEVCGMAFEQCHIKMDLYLNALIEPNFMFDDIALMIVAMMRKVHILVLCHNNYWTTRSNFEHKDCYIKLAFFGEHCFKEIALLRQGASEFLGSTQASNGQGNNVDLNKSVVSIVQDPCVPVQDMHDNKDQGGTTDEDLDTDLIGTGLLPESNNDDVIQIDGNANVLVTVEESLKEGSKEKKSAVDLHHGEQTKIDVTQNKMVNSDRKTSEEDLVSQQNQMDVSDAEHGKGKNLDVTGEQNQMDVSDAQHGNGKNLDVTAEQNKMDVSDAEHTNGKNLDVTAEQNKMDVSDGEHSNGNNLDVSAEQNTSNVNESETEGEDHNEDMKEDVDNVQTDQEQTDSTDEDSGIEEDGWQSDSKKRKAALRAKKQTKMFQTSDGSLSVRTVGYPKRVVRKKQHKCHLCGEMFEMQCYFTKHYATKHPDNPFKCEHCPAVLQTPNGLFKHQRSHLYLKHECSDCGKRFQFPRQRDTHMKIHTGQELYPCLHCDHEFTLNTTMLTHAKTHNTQLVCELCPKTSTKTFNSRYGLAQHIQGMHKGGWDSFCGKNFKWKSKYSRHLKKCDTCKAEKLRIKKERYLFDT